MTNIKSTETKSITLDQAKTTIISTFITTEYRTNTK